MSISEVDEIVSKLLISGKSINEIIDEMAVRNIYYALFEIPLVSRKLMTKSELMKILKSHKFYSKQVVEDNPFNRDFWDFIQGC